MGRRLRLKKESNGNRLPRWAIVTIIILIEVIVTMGYILIMITKEG